MNAARGHDIPPTTLPELEQLLVRAARGRAAPRFGRRRWLVAALAAALVLAAGAAAATGLLRIAHGSTSEGTFSVETRPVPVPAPGEPPAGTICLQLRYGDRGAAFGCGDAPSAERPFGLLVSDPLEASSREGVVYGLVAGDIARVSVVDRGGKRYGASTEAKQGLPGRFFAVVVPRLTRVEVVGYDGAGEELARVGGSASSKPPLSHAEAVEQGDPAGFAPTRAAPTTYLYEGREIGPAAVNRLELACLEDRRVIRCYDSTAELEIAQGVRGPGAR